METGDNGADGKGGDKVGVCCVVRLLARWRVVSPFGPPSNWIASAFQQLRGSWRGRLFVQNLRNTRRECGRRDVWGCRHLQRERGRYPPSHRFLLQLGAGLVGWGQLWY